MSSNQHWDGVGSATRQQIVDRYLRHGSGIRADQRKAFGDKCLAPLLGRLLGSRKGSDPQEKRAGRVLAAALGIPEELYAELSTAEEHAPLSPAAAEWGMRYTALVAPMARVAYEAPRDGAFRAVAVEALARLGVAERLGAEDWSRFKRNSLASKLGTQAMGAAITAVSADQALLDRPGELADAVRAAVLEPTALARLAARTRASNVKARPEEERRAIEEQRPISRELWLALYPLCAAVDRRRRRLDGIEVSSSDVIEMIQDDLALRALATGAGAVHDERTLRRVVESAVVKVVDRKRALGELSFATVSDASSLDAIPWNPLLLAEDRSRLGIASPECYLESQEEAYETLVGSIVDAAESAEAAAEQDAELLDILRRLRERTTRPGAERLVREIGHAGFDAGWVLRNLIERAAEEAVPAQRREQAATRALAAVTAAARARRTRGS